MNSTVELVRTARPNNSVPLNFETLWWSRTQDTIYQIGGELSHANGTTTTNSDYNVANVPPESIWQFNPSGNGSGNWTQALGPIGRAPYPPGFINTAHGASANNDAYGYYIGGYASQGTTRVFGDLGFATFREEPGLLTFSFDTLHLTNTSDGGYFASQYHNDSAIFDAGNMIFIPSFGIDGVLVLLGGSGYSNSLFGSRFEPGVGSFNNITLYDIHTGSWLWQTATSATGELPMPRGSFCAIGIQGGDNSTFEM